MSATTLLLMVTMGVFCGTSLLGAAMIFWLWWQANQGMIEEKRATVQEPLRRSQPSNVASPPPVSPSYVPQQNMMPIPSNIKPDLVGHNQVWLDGIGGMVSGQRIIVTHTQALIGRSGVCDIQLHDPKISRQHAMLRLQNGVYELEDLRSTGGTYVNGKRINHCQLRDRDQIRMGDSILVFRQL
ncbi:MAG: hypothetical protein CUN55_08110 [Phototrophicales bacterium]|nr:MAG: hypothetical protein CUN55_08110 [Phototrophicales bacterium]